MASVNIQGPESCPKYNRGVRILLDMVFFILRCMQSYKPTYPFYPLCYAVHMTDLHHPTPYFEQFVDKLTISFNSQEAWFTSCHPSSPLSFPPLSSASSYFPAQSCHSNPHHSCLTTGRPVLPLSCPPHTSSSTLPY